jgi:hypothetical protein
MTLTVSPFLSHLHPYALATLFASFYGNPHAVPAVNDRMVAKANDHANPELQQTHLCNEPADELKVDAREDTALGKLLREEA